MLNSSHIYTTVYSCLVSIHNGSTTTSLVSDIAPAGENFVFTYEDRGPLPVTAKLPGIFTTNWAS